MLESIIEKLTKTKGLLKNVSGGLDGDEDLDLRQDARLDNDTDAIAHPAAYYNFWTIGISLNPNKARGDFFQRSAESQTDLMFHEVLHLYGTDDDLDPMAWNSSHALQRMASVDISNTMIYKAEKNEADRRRRAGECCCPEGFVKKERDDRRNAAAFQAARDEVDRVNKLHQEKNP